MAGEIVFLWEEDNAWLSNNKRSSTNIHLHIKVQNKNPVFIYIYTHVCTQTQNTHVNTETHKCTHTQNIHVNTHTHKIKEVHKFESKQETLIHEIHRVWRKRGKVKINVIMLSQK